MGRQWAIPLLARPVDTPSQEVTGGGVTGGFLAGGRRFRSESFGGKFERGIVLTRAETERPVESYGQRS